jgi:Flp pilus assembly protein TadG
MDSAMKARHRIDDIGSQRGQAAVEFALLAPVVVVLLLAVIEFGVAFNNYLTVTDAARAAARKAIVARVSGITVADVQQAARDAASDLNPANLGVTVADPTDPTFTQSGSTLTVTVTYPYSISILGVVVSSGNLTSTMTDRLE